MKMQKQINRYVLIAVLIAFMVSCVRQPDEPEDKPPETSSVHGAFILCEGLWYHNNSRLDRYDLKSGELSESFFTAANPDWENLGDIANHIAIMGDTGYISLSGSNFIEVFNVRTGKHIHSILLKDKSVPRRIYILNRDKAYVSNLYGNSLTEFNPLTFSITRELLPTGPGPESITGNGEYIFVANSGLGDYWYTKPGAGTISVLDAVTGTEISRLNAGVNTVELIPDIKRKRLYAAYYHLPSKADSAGGIIEYDLEKLKESRRIIIEKFDLTRFAFSAGGDTLFYLDSEGVSYIDLRTSGSTARLITNTVKTEFWTALALNPADNTLWIGNSKNFNINGEILIYKLTPEPVLEKRFGTGVNPNTIVFY